MSGIVGCVRNDWPPGEAAALCMRDHTGILTIAFNGGIYNCMELRDELKTYPFRSHTDTEVLLAAYARWGTECLTFLNGMFALAFGMRSRNSFSRLATVSVKNPFTIFAAAGLSFLPRK